MNKKIELTLVTLLLTIGSAFGQNDFRSGFIITLESDTIQGQVDYRSNSKNYASCIFKSEQGVSEYYPNQISGFGYINDRFFSSQIIESSFVEVLVRGEISLYKSRDMYHVKKDTLLYDLVSTVEKVEIDRQVGMREKSRWRGILSYLVSDCLKNSNSLTAEIRFDEEALTQLVVKYNKCSGQEFLEYKVSKPWVKFDFGATIGVSGSEIRRNDRASTYPFLADSYNSIDPTIGLITTISSPRITEKIAFQGEIHFLKSDYSSLVELKQPFNQYHDIFIDLTTLSFPLSIMYSFPEKKYGFYIQAGINYDYHLSADIRLLSEQVDGNVINTFSERSVFDINNHQIGYWGGIGILKAYQRFRGSLAIRYHQMSALIRTDGLIIASNNRASVNLILFKK
jgi:hypothetical protein